MKKMILLVALMLSGGVAMAQDVTIGTSTSGSQLSMAMYYKGNARDTGTYNGVAGNIWNCTWFFYDGVTPVFADQNFSAHTNQVVVNGTPATTATSFTSTGLTFGSTTPIANLTADLNVVASEPVPGSSARVTWNWTFNNSSASPKNLRVVWMIDADVALGGITYDANYVGITNSANNTFGAAGIGKTDGLSGVSLNDGVLMDANIAPTYISGLADDNGPSYYWSNQPNYAGNGIEAQNEIAPSLRNVVEQDSNSDYVSDVAGGADSAALMQFDIVVPASGSASATMYLTFGADAVLAPGSWSSSVNEWNLY